MLHGLLKTCQRLYLALVCLVAFPLGAQGITTAFSEVKFDRAKTPAVIHGGASVDVATGALSFDVPMGPGVGARGVRFVPRLTTRFSSQTPPLQVLSGAQTPDQVSPGGISCTFSPGYFVRGIDVVTGEFLLPDGTPGVAYVTSGGTQDAMQLVNDFGITGVTSAVVSGYGPQGERFVDLSGPSIPTITLYLWEKNLYYPSPDTTVVPRHLLVVSADGQTATEFQYVNPQYQQLWSGSPSPTGSGYSATFAKTSPMLAPGGGGGGQVPPENDLLAVHYLPLTWRNRFGDVITFNHAPNGGTGDGVSYTANWSRNGGATLASVSVSLVASSTAGLPQVPAINGGGLSGGQVATYGKIQIGYSDSSQTTYSMEAFGPYGTLVDATGQAWGKPQTKPWDAFRRNLQPYTLTVTGTGETVQFEYQPGTSVNNLYLPATLKSLTFPHRKQTFTWQPYTYRRPTGNGYITDPYYEDNFTTAGITGVIDQDLTQDGSVGAGTRTTIYQRVVPVLDSRYPSGPYWTNTAFWVAVTHPDGRVTTTRFAEPVNGDSLYSSAPPARYQGLAHIKNLPVDVREYSMGQDWQSDLRVAPSQSIAYQVTEYGAPLVGTPGSPAGEASRFSVGSTWINPYWNLATPFAPDGNWGTVPYATRKETWTKDATGAVFHRIESRSNWDGTGRGWQTETIQGDLGGIPISKTTTRHFETDLTHWFLGRVTELQKPGEPAVEFIYNTNGTVQSATLNRTGSPWVATSYTYNGLPDPSLATLSGQNLKMPGNGSGVGASYGFDGYGLTNVIAPLGVNWTLGEAHDAFGRVIQQTGANGEAASVTWDPEGRLSTLQVTAPSAELATTITYPDLLTAVVTRGLQQTTYRYNGFGELSEIDRPGGKQIFQYDSAGRTLFVSVWIPAGWATGPGTAYVYDNQGRLGLVTDPNGVRTQTTYAGPTRTVRVGDPSLGVVTTFVSDPLGRLSEVTDGMGHLTQYSYDDADRLLNVQQYSATDATASGICQTRTWRYNALGWLYSLTQPESGTTTYSAFDVKGNPWSVDYNGRELDRVFDTLGRVSSISSPDGSVTQNFLYDQQEAGHGLSNSKLIRATANGVDRSLGYFGLNGRLSQLTRSVDGLSWTEFLGYDPGYGVLTSRTYPDGRVQSLGYDFEKGLPNGTNFGGSALATLGYDPTSWAMNQISYGNGASSSFTYDADQTRLHGMSHAIPGAAHFPKDWTFVYDSANRLTSDGEDWYAYDALGRLTSAFVRDPFDAYEGLGNAGVWQQLAFDPFGNRSALTSSVVTNWTAGSAPPAFPAVGGASSKAETYAMTGAEMAAMGATNHLPASIGGVSTGAQYDPQGNLTQVYGVPGDSGRQLALAYDALARVTRLDDTMNGTSQSYAYDDEGLRIRMTDSATGMTTYNFYNEARQLIATYVKPSGGASSWKKDVIYVGTKEFAEADASGTEITLVDHLGSPRFAWRGSGEPVKEKYLPFGENLADPSSAAAFGKGFTNHEQTDPSGLIYMQARFYAPMYGRFLSPDPARDQHFEETQSWNIYSYVQNNPVMSIDPTGMVGGPYDEMLAFGRGVLTELKSTAVGLYHMVAHHDQVVLGAADAAARTILDPKGTAAAVGKNALDTVRAADTPEKQAELAGRVVTGAAVLAATEGLGEAGVGARAGELAEAGKVGEGAAVAGDWAELSGMLRSAASGKGNFGIGEATAEQAAEMGKAWVGDGARLSKDGSTWVSKDGLRTYRSPSAKPNSELATTGVQANFERKLKPGGRPISNAHLDIK